MRRLAGPVLLMLALSPGCGPSTPAVQAPPPTFDLMAWEYPGARPIARFDPELIASGKVGLEEIAAEPREAARIRAPALYAYDTSDTLETVYAFFGRKLDLDPEYRPSTLTFQDKRLSPSGPNPFYADQPDFPTLRASYTGLTGRQAVRTATMVGPGGPGFSVVVVLSRGKSEGFTTIELVVTPAR